MRPGSLRARRQLYWQVPQQGGQGRDKVSETMELQLMQANWLTETQCAL